MISYVKSHEGKYPTKAIIAKTLFCSMSDIKKAYQELLATGDLVKPNSRRYVLADKHLNSNKLNVVQNKVSMLLRFNKIVLLKIVSTLFFFCCLSLSIDYTFQWLDYTIEAYKAIIFSVFIVGFLNLAFQFIILFINKKAQNGWWKAVNLAIAFVFFVAWLLCLIYSINSTIAGQYNAEIKNTKVVIVENNESNKNKMIIDTLNNSIIDWENEIKFKEQQRTEYLSIMKSLNIDVTNDRNVYNRHNRLIYNRSNEIDALRKEIVTNRLKIQNMLQDSELANIINIETNDIYKWYSNILGISTSIVKFYLNIFLAIIIDIISPLLLGFVFFYRKE
jgi:hypothetical protein